MSQFYCVIYIYKNLHFFLKLVGLPSDVWPKFTSIYLCFSAPPDPLAGFKGNETTGKEQKEGRKGNGHPLLPPIPWSPLHRQCRINANQGPWQLFARARQRPITASHSSRYMLAIISSRYQYGPFLVFLLQKLCQITWLLTGWKFFFSTSGGPPEAWSPWHLPHLPHG